MIHQFAVIVALECGLRTFEGHHLLGSCPHLICGGTLTWKCVTVKCSLRLCHWLSLPYVYVVSLGQLDSRLRQDLVLPSGSVLFNIASTDLDLEMLWNVLRTFNIIDIVLVNLDAVGVPSLRTAPWSWPGSGMSVSAGSVMSPSLSTTCWCSTSYIGLILSIATWWSATWAEMVLKTTFMAFLPNAGQSLNWCIVLHLLHILLSQVLWPLILCELLVLVLFLPFHLNVLMASTVVGWVIPPFDLRRLKSFTVISCSFAYWSSAWYVTSLIVSSISPISLPQNV